MSNEAALRQLHGADMAVVGLSVTERLAVMMALQTCEPHAGAHHFGVVGEGSILICSKTAISCLEEQGVKL